MHQITHHGKSYLSKWLPRVSVATAYSGSQNSNAKVIDIILSCHFTPFAIFVYKATVRLACDPIILGERGRWDVESRELHHNTALLKPPQRVHSQEWLLMLGNLRWWWLYHRIVYICFKSFAQSEYWFSLSSWAVLGKRELCSGSQQACPTADPRVARDTDLLTCRNNTPPSIKNLLWRVLSSLKIFSRWICVGDSNNLDFLERGQNLNELLH